MIKMRYKCITEIIAFFVFGAIAIVLVPSLALLTFVELIKFMGL